MSISLTIRKKVINPYPELSYQLFYLSENVQETEQQYIFIPKGYYRDLSTLLDLYQLPYQLHCSRNIRWLHVFLLEDEAPLAEDLQRQFYLWGFGKVSVAATYREWRLTHSHRPVSLALIDTHTLETMPPFQRIHILLYHWFRPLLLLTQHWETYSFFHRYVLRKPFAAVHLQESVERQLNVII
jgi:hypothetical protein